jgi:hypothetical protein
MKPIRIAALAACLVAPSFPAQVPGASPGNEVPADAAPPVSLDERFRLYLTSTPPAREEENEYRIAMHRIAEAMRPGNRTRENVANALALLPMTSSIKHDGWASIGILRAVHRVYLSRASQAEIDLLTNRLGKKTGEFLWRGDRLADDSPGNSARYKILLAACRAYEDELKRLEEAQRMAKTQPVSEIAAQSEFDTLLAELFLQNRFDLVLIGCAFHNHLFGPREGGLKIDKDDANRRILSDRLGGNLTPSGLEAAARAAITTVEREVKSFDHRFASGEFAAAYRHLRQAFALGEHLPVVRAMPVDKKQRLIGFQGAAFLDTKNGQE